jgi:hypothetical protein
MVEKQNNSILGLLKKYRTVVVGVADDIKVADNRLHLQGIALPN